LACKKNLPKYNNFQEFRDDFNASHVTRRNAKALWNKYHNDPDGFYNLNSVQRILKAEGRLPYSLADRVEQVQFKTGQAYTWSQGKSWGAKAVQGGTEFVKGLVVDGCPEVL
jgi:hypothetical protein